MFHFGLCGESVPFEVTSVENGSQVVIDSCGSFSGLYGCIGKNSIVMVAFDSLGPSGSFVVSEGSLGFRKVPQGFLRNSIGG